MRKHLRWIALLVMTVWIVPMAAAQDSTEGCWQWTKSDLASTVKGIPGMFKDIPGGVAHGDYEWLLPVGLASGLLIGTHADQRATAHITDAASEQRARNISNGLIVGEFAGVGLTYLVGCRAHSHLGKAAFHALEAAGLAATSTGILKTTFRREYPNTPGGDGRFWHSGTIAGSFPSGHTANTFAIASAFAHEYPHNKWVAITGYSLAIAVSGLRFAGKTHFPSELLVGGAIGYPIGRRLGGD